MVTILLEGKSGNKYRFRGPYSDTHLLKNKAGVYAILCEKMIDYTSLMLENLLK